MREPRPSRPLPHLSGAICTTDHVVSANLTAPRTPRAPAPGPSPLRGVLGSPPALGLPAARAFLPLQLSLTPLASSAARTPPPSSALPVGSCDPEGWPPPPQGHRDPTHAQPEPSLQEALLRCRAARRCGSRPSPSARHGKAPLRAAAVGRRPESPQPTCSQRGWLRGSGSHPPCAAGARCGARGAASRGHPSLRRRPWARAFLLWGCFGLCVRKNGDVGPASPGL